MKYDGRFMQLVFLPVYFSMFFLPGCSDDKLKTAHVSPAVGVVTLKACSITITTDAARQGRRNAEARSPW